MSGMYESWQRWLERVVAFLPFFPDRRDVRQELLAHLEDKAADLRRIFPDLTAGEAERAALDAMGNAEEIGRELALQHRPWVGYLWLASRWLLWLMLAVLLVEVLLTLRVVWDLVWPEIDCALAELFYR